MPSARGRDGDAAVKAAERALELDPTFAAGHSALGDSARKQGEWCKARAHYEKFLELAPRGQLDDGARQFLDGDACRAGNGLRDARLTVAFRERGKAMMECIKDDARTQQLPPVLTLEFRVQPDGTTSGTKLREAGQQGSTVEACLARVVSAARFPKFTGEPVVFVFPFAITTRSATEPPGPTAESAGRDAPQRMVLMKSDILAAIKKNKADISRCVQQQRNIDARRAEGVLKMTWTINRDGTTSEVGMVGDEFDGTAVGTCLTSAIRRWKFPAYSGEPLKPIMFPFKLEDF